VETLTEIGDIQPITRPESVVLAQAETARMAAMLRSLSPADWTAPTDCPAWDVRAMAGHVLGMTETFSGLRRFATSMRAGGKAAGDGQFIDGLTAVQVAANAGLTTDTLIERLEAGGPVQARWRGRRRLMRRIPLKQPMPDGTVETWRLAFLVDIILTRDTWMHRVDIAHATGRSLELTAAHDGRIVADVLAEWARRHGQPCTLHLSGPAGGTFVSGQRGEQITIDAVEFCRILSGRATGTGLLAQAVPF
jgi:uncharacterized protein (TIGR03083 family)